MLNYFHENNVFSGNVLLQKNGETIYKGDFNTLPNNSNLYRIGSITKVFTATIIFQLIEDGQLSLDTKLNQYFPAIKNADNITIGNMLNHTSGIYDYLQWKDYYTKKSDVYNEDDLVALIRNGKPEFKPGKESSYSNSNYILLGFIIEKITGKSFAENVKSRITEKLNLDDTYVETSEKEYAKRNSSYMYDGENWVKEKETNPTFTRAAGSVVSSSEDLAKLMKNLFEGKLISEASLEHMKRTDPKTWIGYGLFKAPFYKKNGYGHTGRIEEFHSFAGYFPEDQLSVVILSNGTNTKLNDIGSGVMSKYFNEKYKIPSFSSYTSETAPSTHIYIGTYKAKLAGIITVGTFKIAQAANNHLFVIDQNNGAEGEKALLERKGENIFYSRKYNSEFNFILNKKGKITGIMMKNGKQSIKCKKVA